MGHVDPGLLPQLPGRRSLKALVWSHEPSGKREPTCERLLTPFDQERLQRAVADREDHEVHCDREGRVRGLSCHLDSIRLLRLSSG